MKSKENLSNIGIGNAYTTVEAKRYVAEAQQLGFAKVKTMFKTGQPNPDAFDSNSNTPGRKGSSNFKSLDEFSYWLDQQLEILEEKHKDFETFDSVRSFFQRS